MSKRLIVAYIFIFTISCDIGGQIRCGKSIIQIERDTIECPLTDWQLVFAENFAGNSIDTSIWALDTGNPPPSDRTLFPVTYKNDQYIQEHEAQLYKDENISVKNGKCIITARKEKATYRGIHPKDQPCMSRYDRLCGQKGGIFNYEFDYTSGFLRYKNGHSAKDHLKIEARIKLPLGTGFFPAFWSFTGREEVDFFELFGQPEFPLHAGLIEWKKGSPKSNCSHNEYEWPRDSAFHLYTVELTPYWLKIFLDDELMVTIPKYSSVSDKIAYNQCGGVIPAGEIKVLDAFPNPRRGYKPLINLAIYDWVDEKKLPATLEIDYVKIYQKEFCGSDDNELVISKDSTLTSWARHEYKSISIKSGSRLNIWHTDVSLATGGKIIVENGAMLHIGKSTIAAKCDSWNGIIVKPGGKLTLGNEAIIEHAKTGVLLENNSSFIHKKDGHIRGSNVGIYIPNQISIFDAGITLTFSNNQKALVIEKNTKVNLTSTEFLNNNIGIESKNILFQNLELKNFRGNLIDISCSDCPQNSQKNTISVIKSNDIINKIVMKTYLYFLARF